MEGSGETYYLLLHGYGGTHPEHWQSYLAEQLKEKGGKIIFPNLPSPDFPQKEAWLSSVEKILKGVSPDSLIVAAHSLGCALWLHYLALHPQIKPKKFFLVAPPLNDCGIVEIANFFPLPTADLSSQDCLMIGSDNDPFIPENEFRILAKNLNIPLKIIPGVGHINAPLHGNWEWMNQECAQLINK